VRALSLLHVGDLILGNRIVMAPMTRARAVEGALPHPRAADYYAQRASAGLIITEGSQISPQGAGYARTPGIYSHEHIGAWERVCRKVHASGGKIFLQLWHVGRISHPDVTGGEVPVAPSAIAADAEVFTASGLQKTPVPRALATHEIRSIVDQFERAARYAKRAGFDGVELHGANGYLLDQFLRDGANQRTDLYGGDAANRARLPLEVAEAVIGVWGGDRVSYRISPHFSMLSMADSNPLQTFSVLARSLSALGLGFLHVVEPVDGMGSIPESQRLAPHLRESFRGALILNGAYSAATAEAALVSGAADLISFGMPFIANPDLVERIAVRAPLAGTDAATLYAGEERGYIDYPTLNEVNLI
jgi:N-ethylmaleimide reductase